MKDNAMSFNSKSYEQRLRDAIAKSDKEPDVERAIFILKQAIENEIKLVNKLENMAGFRAWLQGERFELNTVSARKK